MTPYPSSLFSAARAAAKEWSAKGIDYRASVLMKWMGVLKGMNEEIVQALALDTGRLATSRMEASNTIWPITPPIPLTYTAFRTPTSH